MVDIKVGDWVRLEWWDRFHEVLETTEISFVIGAYYGQRGTFGFNEAKWIKREEPAPSPVREVVTKELVDGVYGRLKISSRKEKDSVALKFVNRLGKDNPHESYWNLNSKELRELVKTLNEVAEFLEGE